MTEKIKIEKINDKVETIEVRGQGCWDDCEIWKNNTTAGKINAGEILPHTIISLNKTCNIRLLGNKENFILSMSY